VEYQIFNSSVTSTWMSKKILKRIEAIRGKADYINFVDHSVDYDDFEMRMSYFGDFQRNSMGRSEPATKGISDKIITYYKRWSID